MIFPHYPFPSWSNPPEPSKPHLVTPVTHLSLCFRHLGRNTEWLAENDVNTIYVYIYIYNMYIYNMYIYNMYIYIICIYILCIYIYIICIYIICIYIYIICIHIHIICIYIYIYTYYIYIYIHCMYIYITYNRELIKFVDGCRVAIRFNA